MSTNANIILTDGTDELWFYRHHDGYPSMTGEHLKTFLDWIIEKRISPNAPCAAGWLIILGRQNKLKDKQWLKPLEPANSFEPEEVGAYECTKIWDICIRFFYVIDMHRKEIRCYCGGQTIPILSADDLKDPFWIVTEDNFNEKIEY